LAGVLARIADTSIKIQFFSVGRLLGKTREKNIIGMDFIETGTKDGMVLEPADFAPSDGVSCV
jgi:hypothetical protein